MPMAFPTTGFARLTPWPARAVLLGLLLLAAFCVAMAPPPPPIYDDQDERVKNGDVALYQAEIDRIHAGENYYRVAGEELLARGYPTRSVFNWRTPLPMWLIGQMPATVLGKILLCGLAVAGLLLGFEATSREQPNIFRRGLPLAVLLVGPLLPCMVGDAFVMPVLWAGSFLTLSICAYGVGLPYLGVATGLAAVFFRELALPYCLLAAALAAWHRQRGELAAWLVGLLAWGAFFGLHAWQVSQFIAADSPAHRAGWIQFGGVTFLLSTVQMNGYLLFLPTWITALYFVGAMVGFAGWSTPWGQRAGWTACLFVLAFACVGQSFNCYWGWLTAPLLCFGVVRAPASLAELWQAARVPIARPWALVRG